MAAIVGKRRRCYVSDKSTSTENYLSLKHLFNHFHWHCCKRIFYLLFMVIEINKSYRMQLMRFRIWISNTSGMFLLSLILPISISHNNINSTVKAPRFKRNNFISQEFEWHTDSQWESNTRNVDRTIQWVCPKSTNFEKWSQSKHVARSSTQKIETLS